MTSLVEIALECLQAQQSLTNHELLLLLSKWTFHAPEKTLLGWKKNATYLEWDSFCRSIDKFRWCFFVVCFPLLQVTSGPKPHSKQVYVNFKWRIAHTTQMMSSFDRKHMHMHAFNINLQFNFKPLRSLDEFLAKRNRKDCKFKLDY